MRIETEDYHTGGEPFRIVTGGGPVPGGASVLARRDWVRDNADEMRRFLVNEPRGHPDMYGCYIVPPNDAGAAFGTIFFHKDGYSLACGHGTIALGTWAVQSGRVEAASDGEVVVPIDVPSGRVLARVSIEEGQPRSVVFRNVAAYVTAREVGIETAGGEVNADISWGGAAYASVRASDLGLAVAPSDLPALTVLGREIKWALNDHPGAQHPDDPRLSGIYGTILWEPVESADGRLHQRNVTVFADGQVDRSPCGSGTSARLGLLAEDGELEVGDTLVHHSIVGTVFEGRIVDTIETAEGTGYVTEIEGSAYRTGFHEFVLDQADELGTGFQLR